MINKNLVAYVRGFIWSLGPSRLFEAEHSRTLYTYMLQAHQM